MRERYREGGRHTEPATNEWRRGAHGQHDPRTGGAREQGEYGQGRFGGFGGGAGSGAPYSNEYGSYRQYGQGYGYGSQWRGGSPAPGQGGQSHGGYGRSEGSYGTQGQGQGYGGQTGTQGYYRGEAPRGGPGYGSYGSTGEYGFGSELPGGARQPIYYRQAGYGRAGYGESNFGHGGYPGMPGGSAGAPARGGRPRVPRHYRRSDERICDELYGRLVQQDHIDAGDVSIDVRDGRVILEGSVPERRMKHAIEDLAEGCAGVQDIDNRIRVVRAGESREGGSPAGAQRGGARSLSSAGGANQEDRNRTP